MDNPNDPGLAILGVQRSCSGTDRSQLKSILVCVRPNMRHLHEAFRDGPDLLVQLDMEELRDPFLVKPCGSSR